MANLLDGADFLDATGESAVTVQAHSRPGRRRGLFRLSVRTWLFLILLIGCGLEWIARIVRAGHAQSRAVAAIQQAGGWVVYDTRWDEGQQRSPWQPRWPAWLVDQLGADYLGNVVFVNLHDRGDDAALAHVAQFRHLKQLHRPGFAVTDDGLAHLGQLGELQLFSLEQTQVTDAGLGHLKGLSGLKWLKLKGTRVTEAGVRELKKALPQFQAIW